MLQSHRVRGGHVGLLPGRAEDDPDQDQLDGYRDRLCAGRRRFSPSGNRLARSPGRGGRPASGMDWRRFRRLAGCPRSNSIPSRGHRIPHPLHLGHHRSAKRGGAHPGLGVHLRAVVGVLITWGSRAGSAPRREAPHGGPAFPRRSPGLCPGSTGQRRPYADHGSVGCRSGRGRHQRWGDRLHHGAHHVPPASRAARRAQS